jgi:hypothetical protein
MRWEWRRCRPRSVNWHWDVTILNLSSAPSLLTFLSKYSIFVLPVVTPPLRPTAQVATTNKYLCFHFGQDCYFVSTIKFVKYVKFVAKQPARLINQTTSLTIIK